MFSCIGPGAFVFGCFLRDPTNGLISIDWPLLKTNCHGHSLEPFDNRLRFVLSSISSIQRNNDNVVRERRLLLRMLTLNEIKG